MTEIVPNTASEPAPAYGTNSYMDVMPFLHSMPITRKVKEQVAYRLTLEVTEPALADAFDKLDELSLLKEDWDGEGALPISPRVMKNMKDVLLISDNDDWENWTFGPEVNATIGLQSKHNRALISLGAEEFSYYVVIMGKEIAASHVPFTPDVFLKTMRQIA